MNTAVRYILCALALATAGCCEQTVPTIPADPAIERIFYTRAGGTYFTVHSVVSDGSKPTVVLSGQGYLASVPHHYRIAAVRPSYVDGVIYDSDVVTATTSAKRTTAFAPEGERPATCALASDGSRVAYTTLEGSLYTSTLDGSERIRLADNVYPGIQPAFAHDNLRVAFVGATPPGHTLYVVNVDGSGLLPLASNADTALQSGISWSPSNAVLIYTGLDGSGNQQIYSVGSLGADVRPLTASTGAKLDPVWSPDGYRIAYSRAMANGMHDIIVCYPDGSSAVNITATDGDSERYPHWSPEGVRLLYTANEPPRASLRLLDTASRVVNTIAGDVYGRGFWDYSGR